MTMLKRMVLLAAIVAPGFALADEPAPEAKSLASLEAILEYCAKVDPPAAQKYREQVQLLAQGASEETLAKVRQSDPYQQTRGEVEEFLAKVDAHSAKTACSQHLSQAQ